MLGSVSALQTGPSMKKAAKKKKVGRARKHSPARPVDVPATKGMLDESREELKHEITSARLEIRAVEAKVDALNAKLDAKSNALDTKIDALGTRLDAKIDALRAEMDSRFKLVDVRFDRTDAKIENVLAAVHRVALRVEEQNARNIFVLDGYTSLNDRVEKLEKRDDDKGL